MRWLIFGLLMLSLSAVSFAQIGIGISVRFGPPAIPIYTQPVCPGPGYLWTPGYWGWSDVDGYYWVPGTWVDAPVGLLWTPGYWGWNDGAYVWNDGYWGPTVGFYGGINYGFGYTGEGFYGGEWRGRSFYYNSDVMNVRGAHITNVYQRTVVVNNNHVAYNGGEGGVQSRPNAEQERYAHEHHTAAIAAQRQQAREASQNRALFARENHGRPAIAATDRPGQFKGAHVVAAREAGATYHEPKISPREARVNRNAEKPNAGREQANQQKAGQKNAERQQAERQKTEQKNTERQQANQRKAEQKNAEHQQAQQKNAEQKNTERQQANQRKIEQKNAERQQAQQKNAEQKNTERQQAQQQKAEQKNAQRQQAQQQKQAQREQKQSQQKPERTAQKPRKEEKGPGR
ncbi:MAG: hypothetical protein WA609_11330 [Terriglobales bacterium]